MTVTKETAGALASRLSARKALLTIAGPGREHDVDDALLMMRGCRRIDYALAVETVRWLKSELARLRQDRARREREARLARSARRRKTPDLRWLAVGLDDGSVCFVQEADAGRSSHWQFDPLAGNPELVLRSWARRQLGAAGVPRWRADKPDLRTMLLRLAE